MQRLLKPLTVTFPDDIKVRWPYGRLQMRREQGKFLSLIKALVLLHQYQRKTGTKMAYVQAMQRDVDLALELGKEAFCRNIDDVSPTGRTLLQSIVELVNEKHTILKQNDPATDRTLSEVPFTRKELREATGWSETQVRRNIDHLVELGYLGRINGRHGSTFRYVLLDTGEDDPTVEFRMSELENEGWHTRTERSRSESGGKKGKNEKSTS
jgi:DNA primase